MYKGYAADTRLEFQQSAGRPTTKLPNGDRLGTDGRADCYLSQNGVNNIRDHET